MNERPDLDFGYRLASEKSDALAPATPPRGPSPKAEMQGVEMAEALEAAQFLVDAYAKRRPTEWVPYALLVARALLSAPKDASRDDVLEEAAKVADEYSRLSPLHNYGPAGASRIEKAEMATAQFIAQDIRALKEKPHG